MTEPVRPPVELDYSLEGPEGAPVLVLSSSLGTDRGMWEAQMPALRERFRLLRYDQRGHGASPVPDGPYTIAELGRDAISLLDRLGVERFSFCGLSLGGMVGMWVASEVPERVQSLVLCCTAASLGPPEMWSERAAAARKSGVGSLAEAVLERWYTPDFHRESPEAVEWTAGMLRSTPGEGYAGCCEAIREMDQRDRLGEIRAATLAIAGAEDPATPPQKLEEVVAAIPGARLEVVPRAAHLANIERPEDFNRPLLEHLESAGEETS